MGILLEKPRMTGIWRKFKLQRRKYGIITATSLQNNLAYTSNFVFDTLFYGLVVFVFLQLWRTIYGQGNVIPGYTLTQLLWYLIIAEMVLLSGSSIFHDLSAEVKGGNIAYILNKPYHYVWYQFANGTGVITVKLIVNGITGILLGFLLVGPLPEFRLIYLPPVVLSLLLGITLNFTILTCLGLTAFWLEENTAFFWIYQKTVFMLGLFLPVEFFPEWLQRLALALPFSYITYGPARLGAAFSWPDCYRIIGMQTGYLILFFVITLGIYRRGVKRLNVNGG